jgi:hypothetical protein
MIRSYLLINPHLFQEVAWTTEYPVQGSQPSTFPPIFFKFSKGVSVSRRNFPKISFAAHKNVDDKRLNGVSAFVEL